MDDAGEVLREYATGGPVLVVAHATIDGRPVALAGSRDEHLYAIAADDQSLLWKHKCHVSEERYQSAPWWMMGYAAPVLEILPVDLDEDGAMEVVCGTGGGFIEALSAEGERLWMREFFWGLPDHIITTPAGDEVLPQCADGNVYRISAAGEFLAAHRPDSPGAPSARDHWRFQRLDDSVIIGDARGVIGPLQVAGP